MPYLRVEVLPPRDEPPLLYEPDERLELLCEPEIVVLRIADELVLYDELELRDDDVELPERYDDELLRDDELPLELFTLLFVFELFTVVLLPEERVVEVVPPDTRTEPLFDVDVLTDVFTEPPTDRLLPDDLLLLLELPPWRKLSLRPPVEVPMLLTPLLRVLLSRPLTVDEPVDVEIPVLTFVSLTRYELLVFTPVELEPPRLGRVVVPSTLP